MTIKDLVRKNRSYRRFDESVSIPMHTLEEMVEDARYVGSAMNKQPLRYVLVNDRAKNAEVFKALAWAGYIKDWPGPSKGERPSAYVVVCHDGEPGPWSRCDLGIAAQTIMLSASEKGFGGCMLGALDKDILRSALGIGENLAIMMVLALGSPAEKVVVEDIQDDGDFKYWRDDDSVHHVPKRSTTELVTARFTEQGE